MSIGTVGLPLYKSSRYAFIAFESLCRQETDREWELIIGEEQEGAIGRGRILEQYHDRLYNAGCRKIKYLSIPEHVPLSRKWHEMVQFIAKESSCFLLQASDNYSHHLRVQHAMDIFDKGNVDIMHSGTGLFYDIPTGKMSMVKFSGFDGRMGMDKAFKSDLIRKLPSGTRASGVDGWIRRNIRNIKGNTISVYMDRGYHWMYGLNTNGVNTITTDRSEKIANNTPPYQSTSIKPSIPGEVFDRIKCINV